MTDLKDVNIMDTLELISDTGRNETRFKETPVFKEGVYRLHEDVYAWMVPNGSWGESNAGLILGKKESLLVDTLWDVDTTREMLTSFEPIIKNAPITKVVNTHADGDHYWGNQMVKNTEIIASRKCSDEMAKIKPASMILLKYLGRLLEKIKIFNMEQVGRWFKNMVSPYNFNDIVPTFPTRTFEKELSLDIGGKTVLLIEVGPAHTEGDIFVYLEDLKILFASDILFIGSTPVMWAGPVNNCLKALDLIIELGAEIIVPGHGPATNQAGVLMVKAYWNFLYEEVNTGFKKGWKADKTATEIVLGKAFSESDFITWNSPERIMANTYSIYRELEGRTSHPKPPELMKIMRNQALLAHKMPEAQPLVMRKSVH